ncbi:MAG: hypothetical protein IRY84_19150 [Thermobispora bispora]|nr:hypothetical protein [Thermobispora bispora]
MDDDRCGLATISLGWVSNVVALSALMAIDGFAVMAQSVVGGEPARALSPSNAEAGHRRLSHPAAFLTLSTGASALGAAAGGLPALWASPNPSS